MSKLRFILSVLLLTSCSSAASLLVADADGFQSKSQSLQAVRGSSSIAALTSNSFILPEQVFAEGGNDDDHLAPNSIVAMLPVPEPETYLFLPFGSALLFVAQTSFRYHAGWKKSKIANRR